MLPASVVCELKADIQVNVSFESATVLVMEVVDFSLIYKACSAVEVSQACPYTCTHGIRTCMYRYLRTNDRKADKELVRVKSNQVINLSYLRSSSTG